MDESKMTKEEIIRMAREACEVAPREDWNSTAWVLSDEGLEHFAALVAAAEREAILKDGWRQCAKDQRTTQFCGMVEQAVLTEREACAKLCDELDDIRWQECGEYKSGYSEEIRARSQNDGH